LIRRLALAGAALVAAAPALAQELPSCPDRVTVTDGWTGEVPEGWQTLRRDTQHQLIDIRFYAGPPATAPAVEAVGASSRGTQVSLRYSLPSVQGEVWMSCIYAHTAHTLVRRIEGPFAPHVRINHDRSDGRTFITYN
jgi:hypothetical protein